MSITPYEIEENDDIICNICLTNKFINDISNNNINGTHIKCNICKGGFICQDCIIDTIRLCPICRNTVNNPLYFNDNIMYIENNNDIVINNNMNRDMDIFEEKMKSFILALFIFIMFFASCLFIGWLCYIIIYGTDINFYANMMGMLGTGLIIFLIFIIFMELFNGALRNNNR